MTAVLTIKQGKRKLEVARILLAHGQPDLARQYAGAVHEGANKRLTAMVDNARTGSRSIHSLPRWWDLRGEADALLDGIAIGLQGAQL